jgi:EAL domain-containing protein (putative c-di-GMP-specific phosphodiesterase class I)
MGLPPINMAVNLSARQLRHPYLVALVEDTCARPVSRPHGWSSS